MDNDIKIASTQPISNIKKPTKSIQKNLIYLIIFLFTLHFTPSTYIESTFLEDLVGSAKIGFIYSIASVFTIVGIILARKIIKKRGNFKTFFTMLIAELISLGILSLSIFADINAISKFIFISAFIVGFVARTIAFLNLDIFTEHLSKDGETGSIRGGFLTALNLAFVIGPIFASLLLSGNEIIGKVFFLGFLILIPVIYLSFKYFRNYVDSEYKEYSFWSTFKYIIRHPDLRNIFICNGILFFFYSWMIIYTPIFLHDNIGFSLGQVGAIIGIALLPFVLFQYYFGYLADKKYGEREILTLGFVVAGVSTILMSIFSVKIFALWVIILFITRIGASMIESMVETYLFKKINDQNLDIIAFSRSTRPIAYIISPVLASLFLITIQVNILFLILGILMLSGIYFSTKITDTL